MTLHGGEERRAVVEVDAGIHAAATDDRERPMSFRQIRHARREGSNERPHALGRSLFGLFSSLQERFEGQANDVGVLTTKLARHPPERPVQCGRQADGDLILHRETLL